MELSAIGYVSTACACCFRWSLAVDAAIGQHLGNFVVHDAHDVRLLRALAREAGYAQVTVTQLNFDVPRHSMPPGRLPPAELTTLLQVCRHQLYVVCLTGAAVHAVPKTAPAHGR